MPLQLMGKDSGLLMLLSSSMVYVPPWTTYALLAISHYNSNAHGCFFSFPWSPMITLFCCSSRRIELITEDWTAPPLFSRGVQWRCVSHKKYIPSSINNCILFLSFKFNNIIKSRFIFVFLKYFKKKLIFFKLIFFQCFYTNIKNNFF